MRAAELKFCCTDLMCVGPVPCCMCVQVIQETEAAYLKILESSQTLLTVLKRESINIQKKRQATS